MNQQDRTWWNALQAGGEERNAALGELRTALLRNLRKALAGHRHASDAFLEDAVQDALLRVLDRIGQFQGRSRLVTWATTIAIRVAMGELRRSRWKDVSLDDLMAEASIIPDRVIDNAATAELQAERRALVEALRHSIEHDLTHRQRTALLAEIKGMPQDEIARHLGSNRNAVYKLTHDARKKLKQRLEAAGYTAADVFASAAS